MIATLEACPSTPSNKKDALVGAGMFLGAAVFVGYFGFVVGSLAGAWLGGEPLSIALGVGLGLAPGVWIGVIALQDFSRRAAVWRFELTDAELRVSVAKRGSFPAAIVFAPDPWPAAARGDASGFAIRWADLRAVSFEGLTLDLHLSAERRISLFMRGPDPTEMQTLMEAMGARLAQSGDRTG